LTAGGQNAEAYFSFDGTKLIFQSTNTWTQDDSGRTIMGPPRACYQMYTMDLESGNIRRVSTGGGVTTCGYFFPGDRRVLYSSTHLTGPDCPPKPRAAPGGRYRWSLDDYDIFSVSLDGQRMHRLTATPGYDAEATISPDGKTIVFTSIRDGDLDVYAMNLDGTHVRRLTDELGYDGGPFFSPDSRRIVYRGMHPRNPEEIEKYKALLRDHLVEPSQLEIFVMNADGSGKRQVTANGASNFAPAFLPDGRRIIFASNLHDLGSPSRPTFHLYVVNEDGTGLERVTQAGGFNSFPMFSPDGRKLVWISDRQAGARGEFNVFLADWMP
jgi:Tol biopolymer transport system component